MAKTKNKQITLQALTIDQVLEIVLRPLQINFGICLIILISSIVTSAIIGKQEPRSFTTPICDLNTYFLHINTYIMINVSILIFTIVMFVVVSAIKFNPPIKFATLILSSLIILFILIYVTGGILDSPFTSAVVVYVSSYFIIQERKDLRKINLIILFAVILLTIVPYFLFDSDCEHYIIRWHPNFFTNMLRLFLTIFLIGLTGYWGDKVNKDLTKALYNKNGLSIQ